MQTSRQRQIEIEGEIFQHCDQVRPYNEKDLSKDFNISEFTPHMTNLPKENEVLKHR